jgi:hypothetical protein
MLASNSLPLVTRERAVGFRAELAGLSTGELSAGPGKESDDAVSMHPLYATWQQHAMLEYVYQFVIVW